MQLIILFRRILGKKGPIFVFFGSLLEVFVYGIELLEGDLLFELVEVEDLYLDYSLSALIGAIGDAVLSFFVDGVKLIHLHQHSVLLVDLVLFYVLAEFFLSDLLHLLVPLQVFGGGVLNEGGFDRSVFCESVGGGLFRYGSLFDVRSRPWQSALCPFFALALIGLDELV